MNLFSDFFVESDDSVFPITNRLYFDPIDYPTPSMSEEDIEKNLILSTIVANYLNEEVSYSPPVSILSIPRFLPWEGSFPTRFGSRWVYGAPKGKLLYKPSITTGVTLYESPSSLIDWFSAWYMNPYTDDSETECSQTVKDYFAWLLLSEDFTSYRACPVEDTRRIRLYISFKKIVYINRINVASPFNKNHAYGESFMSTWNGDYKLLPRVAPFLESFPQMEFKIQNFAVQYEDYTQFNYRFNFPNDEAKGLSFKNKITTDGDKNVRYVVNQLARPRIINDQVISADNSQYYHYGAAQGIFLYVQPSELKNSGILWFTQANLDN